MKILNPFGFLNAYFFFTLPFYWFFMLIFPNFFMDISIFTWGVRTPPFFRWGSEIFFMGQEVKMGGQIVFWPPEGKPWLLILCPSPLENPITLLWITPLPLPWRIFFTLKKLEKISKYSLNLQFLNKNTSFHTHFLT